MKVSDLNDKYRYSQRIYNLYVSAVKSPITGVRSKIYAELLEELLHEHFRINLIGRGLGTARSGTKSLLREIAWHKKNRTTAQLGYVGADATELERRDKIHWDRLMRQWHEEEDQALSLRAMETEPKALRQIGKLLKQIEGFANLHMSSMDDAYLCASANALMKIIQNNGYQIDPINGKLIKTTTIIHF
ncbi:hypothetical protein [Pedobacter sp.]